MVCLAEMALRTSLGIKLEIEDLGLDFAFGEDQARYVVTCSDADSLLAAASDANVPCMKIGKVIHEAILQINDNETISLDKMADTHEAILPQIASS